MAHHMMAIKTVLQSRAAEITAGKAIEATGGGSVVNIAVRLSGCASVCGVSSCIENRRTVSVDEGRALWVPCHAARGRVK